ncbi:MAG TPA: hypothetical protein PLW01_11030 [Agitococcus sp.]|nr:hypothetical protein [Agitococcus sp.]
MGSKTAFGGGLSQELPVKIGVFSVIATGHSIKGKEIKMMRFGLVVFSVMVLLALIFAVAKFKDAIIAKPTKASEFVEHNSE